MRRFEFTDGSSQKFWEIDLQGTGFTVRWGRIGTDGQTQQKSFPTDVKAQTEHDKLIAEKQKKGYTEAGGTSSAAVTAPASPAPAAPKASAPKAQAKVKTEEKPPEVAPTPAPPPPPPDTSGPIFWTDDLLRRVIPRRGGVAVPVRPLMAPKKAWALMREDFKKRTPEGISQDSEPGNLTAESHAVAARLATAEPSIGTPEEDAVLLTFLNYREGWGHTPRSEPGIDLLFALGGPVHTTRALLLSLDMHLAGGLMSKARRGVNTEERTARYSRLSQGHLHGLPRLRALLAAQTDDASYQAARDAAASLRSTGEQRAASAFLFPTETDWVHAEAEVYTQEKEHPVLLSAVSTPDALALFTPLARTHHLTQDNVDYIPSMLDGMGTASLSLFQDVIKRLYPGSDFLRAWAGFVASINSDEAMALLIEQSAEHGKEMMGTLLDAAVRWPHRALRLLAPKASVRGKEGDAARSLLTSVVRRHAATLPSLLAGQSEEALQVVARLQEQSGPDVPDATPEQLPPVLARPPWMAGHQPEPLPVLTGVVPPALPDALAWREGEQAEWLQRKGPNVRSFHQLTDEQWHAFARDTYTQDRQRNARHEGSIDPAFFAQAPEALARQYISHLRFWRWGWSSNWMPRIIARLGLDALPSLLDLYEQTKGESAIMLGPAAVTGLAPQMAETFQYTKKFRHLARDWLLRHPAHATAGLLVPALGKPGKAKDAACAALRLLASEGHEATVLDIASRSTPPARDAVARVLSFDPLHFFPAKYSKPPEAFGIRSLPPPLLADRSAKLPPDALDALATMLSFSTLEEPYVGLEQVKAACDRPSLARFAWALFEAWLLAGFPSKENWAFQSLGPLGDDDTARKLAPLIRLWPGEAAHARAVTGLDILATIGTDVTLIYLNGIAEKVKFKGLQQKAQEKIEQIAEARGLTREELADRLVPDLGLDDSGSLSLDFGPRTFTVGFDEQLKPFVRDSDGTRLKDLPKPTQKDDTDKATAAAEQWKALKKDAKVAAGTQILRLELAMCARRRWSPEVFRQFFVEHPLLIHVVRRLVWGVYSPEGAVQSTFRVAEDRSLADSNDDTFTLPEGALVGLPHALELDEKTAGVWSQLFADYQLIQPFPQLGRPTYAPSAEEKDSKSLERVKGLKLPTGKVLGLEARGWQRGAPQDGGVACWMEKPMGPNLVAYLDLDPGLFTGMLSESPEQLLGTVALNTENFWRNEGGRPFGSLDPILFSELIRDLEGLRPA